MPRPFMIAFVARSGSTAIKNDLAQHPHIDMRAEAMGGAKLPPYPGDRTLSDDNRLAWLDHHWRPEVAAQGTAAGFKLQFNRGEPQFGDLDRLAEAFRRHQPVIFRLERANRVKHAVAVLRASALQRLSTEALGAPSAHITADSPEPIRAFANQAVEIDIPAFERMTEAIALNMATMDEFLENLEPVVELTYEEYVADRMGLLNRIAAEVGVEEFDTAPGEVLRKISNDDLRVAVANYDELTRASHRLGLNH